MPGLRTAAALWRRRESSLAGGCIKLRKPQFRRYFARNRPLTRAITGLCAGKVVLSSWNSQITPGLESHDRTRPPALSSRFHYDFAVQWTAGRHRRRSSRHYRARHRLDGAVARLYRHLARTRPPRLGPPVTGPHRAGFRTAGRKDQGPGSHPAGIDRPIAGGAGSVADRAEVAFRAADRHQKAVR